MGLVATLKSLTDTTDAQLKRYNPNRPYMVDGSLSEIVTQALNIAYSKRDFTTGEPYYGARNADGNPPPGAGSVPNAFAPDAMQDTGEVVRPSLESNQQALETEAESVAAILGEAIDASRDDATEVLDEKPMIMYAIPRDGMVTEEMNSNIELYGSTGAIDPADFMFVYTDQTDALGRCDERVVDITTTIKDYENKGARVFQSLESFCHELHYLRARK